MINLDALKRGAILLVSSLCAIKVERSWVDHRPLPMCKAGFADFGPESAHYHQNSG
jgi:hypothetical protein